MKKQLLQHILIFIFCSLLLHIVIIYCFIWLQNRQNKTKFQLYRFTLNPKFIEQFKPKPTSRLPSQLLNRAKPNTNFIVPYNDVDHGIHIKKTIPDIDLSYFLKLKLEQNNEKVPWEFDVDSIDIQKWLDIPIEIWPEPPDLVEIDAIKRTETVIFVDAKSGKLKEAFLHIPAKTGRSANRLENLLANLKNGAQLKWKTPINYKVKNFQKPLRWEELDKYPVIISSYIELRSQDILVKYLKNGGAVLGGNLGYIYQKIQEEEGDRIQLVYLELEHPIFRSFYTIKEYVPEGSTCPPIRPVPAVTLDGRVIAVGNLSYDPTKPCIANKVYANALAYLLIQPGKIGKRYQN